MGDKVEGRTGRRSRLGEGLDQYFRDDFSVPSLVHPFMSEIAHLASHLGITQGSLAKSYNEIAGTNIDSPNVQRHFHTRRLSRKVVETYAKIFKLSSTYVDLLLALDGRENPHVPEPGTLNSHVGIRSWLDEVLGTDEIGRLFDSEAFHHARGMLWADKTLAYFCMSGAKLAWERHRHFGLLIGSGLSPTRVSIRDAYGGKFQPWEFDGDFLDADPWHGTGISEEALVKWLCVAGILKEQRGFDLLEYVAKKSRKRLAAEATMLNVWYELREKVNWLQWVAIRAQMEAAFAAKQLPVEEMLDNLHSDIGFIEWADSNDPERAAHNINEYEYIRELERLESP
jgi:hypothetical protein